MQNRSWGPQVQFLVVAFARDQNLGSAPASSSARKTMCLAGQWSDMVISTIELGISILRGGNVDVQKVTRQANRNSLVSPYI